jgi:hypothetical protein
MTKKSTRLVQLTRRRATSRLRQLLDEMHMLMGAFPDLRDAFDPDELPVAFIVKRDAARAGREFKRPKRLSARPRKPSSSG